MVIQYAVRFPGGWYSSLAGTVAKNYRYAFLYKTREVAESQADRYREYEGGAEVVEIVTSTPYCSSVLPSDKIQKYLPLDRLSLICELNAHDFANAEDSM